MIKRDQPIDYDAHKVASILACLPKQVREPAIEHLQEIDPSIGFLVLKFEDLALADDQGLKTLIDQVEYRDLTLALVTAPLSLQKRIYDNLGQNYAQSLHKDVGDILNEHLNIDKNAKYDPQQHTLDPQPYLEPEVELDSLDAQMVMLKQAAILRENNQLTVDPPEHDDTEINDQLLSDIGEELQLACEKAMAQVLLNYPPEAAAAALCRRLDRTQILEQMLDGDPLNDITSAEMEQLFQSLLALETK